ncbi:MAG: hypothetical protein M1122_01350 [Candidatus Marsarchaeota archaeon]|nr:hypothetical protein [Candidatus Marsarchaeota archaeon]
MDVASLLRRFLSTLGIKDIVKLPERIDIKVLSDNKKHEITNNYNTLNLNIGSLSPEQNKAFAEYIAALKTSKEQDYIVMESKSYAVIEELYKINPNFQAISKLATTLLPEDYGALEDAVYIKYLSDNSKFSEIPERKRQIRYEYGERGNTITNLYTAGYFHGIFLPLYDELLKDPNNLDEFKLIFDRLIRDFPLAIFINRTMSLEEVKATIKNKILKNQKYGIKKLHIHGINKQNCDNIKESVRLLEEEKELTFTKTIDEISNIIMVKLEFDGMPTIPPADSPLIT